MFGKKHKYWKRPQGDALHPDKIMAQLPGGEQLYKQVQDAEQFFTTANRVGGGGTKAGSVGLRFIDRKKSSQLHELYTEPDKAGKPAPPKEFNPHEFLGKDGPPEGPKFRVVSIPSNWCPGCDAVAVNGFRPYWHTDQRTKKFVEQKAMLSVAPLLEAWPEVGLRPGDIVRHILCGRCVVEMRHGSGSRVQIVIRDERGIPEVVPAGVFEYAKFNQRVQENLERFMLSLWAVRKEEMFYGERGEDMAKER